MKNLKKIVLGLMLLLAAFAFVGCPTPEQPAPTPDPEPTPAPVIPVNNFKGNVYVMSCEMFGTSGIMGYLEFTDDTNGKSVTVHGKYIEEEEKYVEFLEEEPFTYTVEDDVATITQTIEGETVSIETSKLVNGKFSIVDKDEETGLELKISCTKGDKSLFVKGSLFYDDIELDSDRFLVSYVNEYDLYKITEEDYSIKDGNIYWTKKAYDKVYSDWTFGEETNKRFYEIYEKISPYGLEEGTDYTIDWETLTVTLTDAGQAKMKETWVVMYNEEKLPEAEGSKNQFLEVFEFLGCIENVDYTIDFEKKAFILTDSGMEKIEPAMGGSDL